MTTDETETETEFVLDADDGEDLHRLESGDVPHTKIRIGGKVYTAYCPKDMLWFALHRAIPSISGDGDISETELVENTTLIMEYMEGAFLPPVRRELTLRLKDPLDQVNGMRLGKAIVQIQKHFAPHMNAVAEALNLEQPTGNRENRRAQASAARKNGARKKPPAKTARG